MEDDNQARADEVDSGFEPGAEESAPTPKGRGNERNDPESPINGALNEYEAEKASFLESLTDEDEQEMEFGAPISGNVENALDDEGGEIPEESDGEVGEDEEFEEDVENEDDSNDENEEEEEGEDEQGQGKIPRLHMRPKSQQEADFYRMMKVAPPGSNPIEIARLAGYQLPASQQPPRQAETANAESAEPQRTKNDIDAEIKVEMAKRREAVLAIEPDDQLAAEDRIEELKAEKENIDRKAAYDRDFDAAMDEAQREYPDYGKPNSEFARRMSEVDAAWDEMGDPRAFAPDKPLLIARLVAKERNVKPASAASRQVVPATPPTTTPPPARKRRGVAPASGSARTQTPGNSLIRRIDSVQSIDDYDAIKADLGFG